ncbi:MAG: bile acid:sodium symporter family protein [Bacteroidales bacterium]|nr:bile acid:sodium symporter family protein [Bacteroidales bacterium]
MIDLFVNIALAVIMLGIGLSLTFKDFKNLFSKPKPIFVGFLSQIIVLPVLAFSISTISHLPDAMKVGIVIIAICPVGASSNLIVHLFRGNVALSISLTIINSLLTPITIPLITNFALRMFMNENADIQLSFWNSISQIGLNVLLPAFIGILIRHYNHIFAKKLEKPLKYILPLILGIVFTLKIFFGDENASNSLTFRDVIEIAPYVLGLNIIGMFAGYYIARWNRLARRYRLTIAIEVGLQNTALALLIAGNLLNNYTMEKPILVYAMFTFFSALLFAWYFSRKPKQVTLIIDNNKTT